MCVAYPNISESGTMALMTCEPARCSIPSMRPRREERSPMMVPAKSSGVTTSTAITGSRRTGDLECHFVGVDIVVAAVVERGLHVDHRIAGEDASFERFPDSLVHRLDEF